MFIDFWLIIWLQFETSTYKFRKLSFGNGVFQNVQLPTCFWAFPKRLFWHRELCRFTVPVVQWKIPRPTRSLGQKTAHGTRNHPPKKKFDDCEHTRFCHHWGSRIHESPRTASKLRCCSWIKRCWASNSSCNSGSFPAKCRISLKLPGAYNVHNVRNPLQTSSWWGVQQLLI